MENKSTKNDSLIGQLIMNDWNRVGMVVERLISLSPTNQKLYMIEWYQNIENEDYNSAFDMIYQRELWEPRVEKYRNNYLNYRNQMR